MSEKEIESKKEELVEEEDLSKKSKRKSTKKDNSPKKEKSKPDKVKDDKNGGVSTILDLIDSLDDTSNLLSRLIESGYFENYKNELKYKDLGYTIAPYIDVDDFYNKMK